MSEERCEPPEGAQELTLFLLRKEGEPEPRLARWLGGPYVEWCVTGFDGMSTIYRGERLARAGFSVVRQVPTTTELAAAKEREAKLVEALKAARQFIVNGVALGFIRMPDASTPDPAHRTLPMIEDALARIRP